MYWCYLLYFIRFLFFIVCLLYVIARMNIYVMFLLRQRRLNKLIINIPKCFRLFCIGPYDDDTGSTVAGETSAIAN